MSSVLSFTDHSYPDTPKSASYSYGAPASSTGSLSPPSSPVQKQHSRALSTSSSSRRSRARASTFQFNMLPSPIPGFGTMFGSRGRRESDAFDGTEYGDDALRDGDEDEDGDGDHERAERELGDEHEDGEALHRKVPAGGRSSARETFQALTQEEIWWMMFSGFAVLALTVVACIVTIIG
ncbi:hypothetical protein P7C70_g261, partial [Phenoliferia sp. Uapishka_3]